MSTTILIIGGYGRFGGNLVRLLAGDARLTLIVAGRSIEHATAFCRSIEASASLVPLALDRRNGLAGSLAELKPQLVVDATGPFQLYGAEPYAVVEACIERRIPYIDLADGSAFVEGIGRFDAAARRRGVFCLSGVSTCPALSFAVIRHLARGMAVVRSVQGGIAPSPKAGLGLAVVKAIAAYAGKPVVIRRGGRDVAVPALMDFRRFTIAPPGALPLDNTCFALVDVPDLALLRRLYPDAETIWFGGGTRPEILLRVLADLAWFVRLRLLPSLSFLAPLFHGAGRWLRWGADRGGMIMAVSGEDARGRRIDRSWHLVAEGDSGPFIPAMAAAAIIKRLLAGHAPEPGARAAHAELELGDFDPLFNSLGIKRGMRTEPTARSGAEAGGNLFQRMIGAPWYELPVALRAAHQAPTVLGGVGDVEGASNLFGRLIAWVFGLPKSGNDIPVEVMMLVEGETQLWRRRFGRQQFMSWLTLGEGREERLVIERFGPLHFAMAIVWDQGRLNFIVRGWRLGRLRLPASWAPNGVAFETVEDGRFRFDVEMRHPLFGRLARYRGWLVPEESGI